MSSTDSTGPFQAKVRRPASVSGSDTLWGFVILPKEVSARLPRRGRTTVEGTVNGHCFQATLDPDGQLSHWLRLDQKLLDQAGAAIGDTVTLEVMPVEHEPEPEIPADFHDALLKSPKARAMWEDTTTMARLDWIHWITSSKQSTTRAQRIANACEMLASGKRRVCCFDPSGFYSKALRPPKEADG